MTTAIASRILGERDLSRRKDRRLGRRAARLQREQVLHATNEVSVLLSLLAAEDEPEG
jgi:hypothetical protein